MTKDTPLNKLNLKSLKNYAYSPFNDNLCVGGWVVYQISE